jgi:hypothetical protein
MKSSWPIKCSCGEIVTLKTTGTRRFPSIACPKCGSTLVPFNDDLIHTRLFNRGYLELHDGDYTLPIVFSAMSVECYVAYLYFKWNKIEIGLAGSQPTEADEDSWAEQLRLWNSVGARFDKVCEFLTTDNFESFIKSKNVLAQSIAQRHPDSAGFPSLKQFFQERLFTRRNKIVHHGKIDYGQLEATECVEIARTLLSVFDDMDQERYVDRFS